MEENRGGRAGGRGLEVNDIGFPLRPGVAPVQAVDEGDGAARDAGELDGVGDGTGQDVGAVFSAAVGVVDGGDFAGREGALIKAEFIKAASVANAH